MPETPYKLPCGLPPSPRSHPMSEITLMRKTGRIHRPVLWLVCLLAITRFSSAASGRAFEVKPLSEEQAKRYTLDAAFYKKCTLVQNILIATSETVSDYTHL